MSLSVSPPEVLSTDIDAQMQNVMIRVGAEGLPIRELVVPVPRAATAFHVMDRVFCEIGSLQSGKQLPDNVDIERVCTESGDAERSDWQRFRVASVLLSYAENCDFVAGYCTAVNSLVVEEVAQPVSGLQRLPDNIDDFHLVPLVPKIMSESTRAVNPIDINPLPGVIFEYSGPNGRPYLDMSLSLGLTFQDRLVAVCAGGVSEDGPYIAQLQDVARRSKLHDVSPKEKRQRNRQSGLYSGIDWKTSLIKGWRLSVQAAMADVDPGYESESATIQGAVNNPWIIAHNGTPNEHTRARIDGRVIDTTLFMRCKHIYDNTARTLGGRVDSRNNYRLPPVLTSAGHSVTTH